MRWSRLLLACTVATFFTGCSGKSLEDPTSTVNLATFAHTGGSGEILASTASTSSKTITVVGDDTAAQVADELRNRGLSVSNDPNTLGSATLIVVAEDAPNGTRDVHHKLAANLAQNKHATVLWVFARMSLIDDHELADLLQTEVQDLLKMHGSSPQVLQFAVDTEQTTVRSETLKGWPAITQFLTTGH